MSQNSVCKSAVKHVIIVRNNVRGHPMPPRGHKAISSIMRRLVHDIYSRRQLRAGNAAKRRETGQRCTQYAEIKKNTNDAEAELCIHESMYVQAVRPLAATAMGNFSHKLDILVINNL